eukprot:GEMP01071426.1.p1 GENE.GEMP01071426.1~~GEMP01071426.1.p1  ORF type:complete len:260 (+),score=39.70 GEMP01071426.1:27-806(+)
MMRLALIPFAYALDINKDLHVSVFYLQQAAIIGITLFVCLVLWATKKLWWASVYRMVCGNVKCVRCAELPVIGCVCRVCCPFLVGPHHQAFRLRILVHQAANIRYTEGLLGKLRGAQMQVYTVVKCGQNPLKTTSAQFCPVDSKAEPVTWNECVDLNVHMTDNLITLQVMDYDARSGDDVIGTANIHIEDFMTKQDYYALNKPPYLFVNRGKTYHLQYKGHNAGTIWLSFMITPEGRRLPPVIPEFDDDHTLPLMSSGA